LELLELFQSSNFSSGPFKHRSKRSYLGESLKD